MIEQRDPRQHDRAGDDNSDGLARLHFGRFRLDLIDPLPAPDPERAADVDPGIELEVSEARTVAVLEAAELHLLLSMVTPVNWLQCLEGLVDTVHVGQLHQAWLPATTSQLGDVAVESAPRYEIVDAPYGLRACADRGRPGGNHYVRVTEYIAPFWSFIPHGPKEDRVSMGIIPIDDTHTMQWYIWYDHNEPLHEGTDLAGQFELLLETPDDFTTPLRGKPKWGQDRKAMGGDHFTGLPNIVLEDVALQESQGTIMDRTREHLGSSDQFVTRTRRLLIRAANRHHASGDVFPAADTPLRAVRAMAVDIADGEDWQAATT